jgi:phosphomannomutase
MQIPTDDPSVSGSTVAPLMLSVSGCRGIVGVSLTPATIARFIAAFSAGICTPAAMKSPSACRRLRVVLARDGRQGGDAIASIARGCLAMAGHDVIDLGVAMTPTVGVMVAHLGADAGLVLTASHNPAEWNGLKPITPGGHAPAKPEADALIERFHEPDLLSTSWVRSADCGTIEHRDDAAEIHVERVLSALGELYDLDTIRAARHTVVLNSVNASGAVPGRLLLERLGCKVVALHDEPSGVFPHTPEPTAENLASMQQTMAGLGAAVGFAQDPDGDRLAILDHDGTYIGEEYTLALGALAVLQRLPAGGAPVLAANLSTSRMIDDLAARHGGTVLRTPVGEANLVAAMQRHSVVVGGEGNGGVIWPRVGLIRDSLVAMALTLALITDRGRPVGAIIKEFPSYAIVKRKQPVRDGLVEQTLDAVRNAFPGAAVSTEDGVRVDVELPASDGGGHAWVHGRPSNTEPIVRLIAEAPTRELAVALLDRVEAAIG